MMRLAFFSPFHPQKSGISEYSEELLPYLTERADIDLYYQEGCIPTNPAITERFNIYPHTQFEQQHHSQPYDLCLYQMGNNSRYHRYMDDFIQRYPGIVTLHDYVLHHFYAEMFADEERYDEYQQAMTNYYGEAGTLIAEKFRRHIRSDYSYYQFPFYQRVVNPSLGTIVHSSYVQTKLLHYDSTYRVALIPMGILPPKRTAIDMDALRTKHQIPVDAFVVASFGFIIKDKRIRELLRVFARFADQAPDALCILAGQEVPDFDVRNSIRSLQLEDRVIITGYTPYEEFLEYIGLADVCVNLRHPTVRATSANILKIMAYEKAVIASDLCEFLDIPTDCCLKVPLNEREEEVLLEALQRLYADRELLDGLGRQGRTFVEHQHSMQQAANRYLAFCDDILRSKHSAPPE